MPKAIGGRQTVPLKDVVLAQALQLQGLMTVLERRGLITAEVPEEVKRLWGKSLISGGGPWRTRTSDPLIKSQLLYQLS